MRNPLLFLSVNRLCTHTAQLAAAAQPLGVIQLRCVAQYTGAREEHTRPSAAHTAPSCSAAPHSHAGVGAVQVMGKEGQQTGWALLRASLHDPLLVINAESDAKGGAPLAGLPVFFCCVVALHTTVVHACPALPFLACF